MSARALPQRVPRSTLACLCVCIPGRAVVTNSSVTPSGSTTSVAVLGTQGGSFVVCMGMVKTAGPGACVVVDFPFPPLVVGTAEVYQAWLSFGSDPVQMLTASSNGGAATRACIWVWAWVCRACALLMQCSTPPMGAPLP